MRGAIPVLALSTVLLVGGGCKTPAGTDTTTSGSGDTGGTIKIGHYASLTGETATFGKESDEGVKLAMKEINAAGGILGKQIEVETQDDQSKAEEAKTVATKFAADDKIVAVLGEVASTRSMTAAPVFQRAGIPMISPSSTNEKVTQEGDYIFRVCFIDNFQGGVMAQFAANDLKAKKVAILREQTSDYSVGLSDVFTEEFKKLGGTITVDASFKSSDTDYRSQLAKAKDADAIFVPAYYNTVGTIARQARELGITAPLLGCDGWDSPTLVEGAGGAGKALEGSYFSNHYSKDDKAPRVQDFVKAYTAEYGKAPSGLAALGYDAMKIVALAIKTAGSADRAKIKDALAQTKDFPGVTGNITIDPNRNASKPAVVLQIQGNDFAYKKTINP
ncbi:MAG: ABC transporter substrate-binding protein [Armatimonadetes bacterium]|nr:ABC transporter substrate-binding protein [Armatimonadota bacterium]